MVTSLPGSNLRLLLCLNVSSTSSQSLIVRLKEAGLRSSRVTEICRTSPLVVGSTTWPPTRTTNSGA